MKRIYTYGRFILACALFLSPLKIFTSESSLFHDLRISNPNVRTVNNDNELQSHLPDISAFSGQNQAFSFLGIINLVNEVLVITDKYGIGVERFSKSVDYENNFSNDVYENFKLLFTHPQITCNTDKDDYMSLGSGKNASDKSIRINNRICSIINEESDGKTVTGKNECSLCRDEKD